VLQDGQPIHPHAEDASGSRTPRRSASLAPRKPCPAEGARLSERRTCGTPRSHTGKPSLCPSPRPCLGWSAIQGTFAVRFGQGIQRLGKGRFVSKSSSLAAATRGPPCHCKPPRYHRGGQSAREGQDLPSLDLLPGPRWTLRGRRAEISSSTLQQLQELSLSLQSALHISVALLVQYRFPSGWRGPLRDTPESQAAGSSSPTQEEAASRGEHPVEAYHGKSKCVPRGISSSVWLYRALPCSCTATLSPKGEEGFVEGPRDSCTQAPHRQRVEAVHEKGRVSAPRRPFG